MAKFLNTSATNYFLEELIKDARDRLILISPFPHQMPVLPTCPRFHPSGRGVRQIMTNYSTGIIPCMRRP